MAPQGPRERKCSMSDHETKKGPSSVMKPEGWFSRRHKTPEAHMTAVALKEANTQEQMDACAIRIEEAQARSSKEQLARLDARLGKGQGAKKERERLALSIEEEKKAKKATEKKDEAPKPQKKKTTKKKSRGKKRG